MSREGRARALAGRVAEGLDQRYRLAGRVRRESSRVTPGHHSFFWGWLALFAFVVLVVTGTILAFFFVPDTTDVIYHGPYDNLRGVHMSRAYRSVLAISFEVRGGLLIRQVHHWAALVFVAALTVHMLRTFFTGAFRKPRELAWFTGALLLIVALVEGYTGYAMLDDLLSSQSVRIFSGLLLSVPAVGTWLHWMVFGGEFEGDLWITRFFTGHVFVLPGVFVALLAAHLALVRYLRHTQFRGPGARERTLAGARAVRGFGARTLAAGLCVAGVLAIMGGIFQIEPAWLWGPYIPANVSTTVQPDWYLGYVIGALKLFPGWSIHLGPYTVPAPFWPGVVLPAAMLALLAVYPYLERLCTGDRDRHNVLERPRDNPGRTALGTAALTLYLVLLVVGGDDVLAIAFNVPFPWLVWAGRVGVFVLPPIAYLLTRKVCLDLQARDRDALERGIRTGFLEGRPEEGFVELRRPPGGVDREGRPVPLGYGGAGIDRRVAAEDIEQEEEGGEPDRRD